MKLKPHTLLFSLGLTILVLGACKKQNQIVENATFSITGEFKSCELDSIHLYTIDGLAIRSIAAAAVEAKNETYTFTLQGSLPSPGFYLLGKSPNNLMSLVAGTEKGVRITGNCNSLGTYSKVENSPINDKLEAISTSISNWKRSISDISRSIAMSEGNPDIILAKRAELNRIIDRQFVWVDSLKKTDPFFGKMAALNLYRPFDPNNNPKKYPDELHHIFGEMIAYADLSDPDYANLPVTDYVRAYIPQLFGGEIDAAQAESYFDAFLSRIPEKSQTHKNALASAINIMEQMGVPSFPRYGEKYISLYQPRSEVANTIRQRGEMIALEARKRAEEEKILGIGAVPPGIKQSMPDGKMFELNQLKGKIVLLDFWASWCKPCRMENPNVVRVYNKYKSKGFEIVSISLDENRDQWLQAIGQDKMTWLHASDLKGFENKAAQDYRVNAIPATFLLDREGKILAKNLRGPSLEAKLADVLAKEGR